MTSTVFFTHVSEGDHVKWFNPSWSDYGSRAEELLNAVHEVTEVKRTTRFNTADTVVVLDGKLEVNAIECVSTDVEFYIEGCHLRTRKI